MSNAADSGQRIVDERRARRVLQVPEETFTNVEMFDPETTERGGLTMMTVAGKGVDAEGEKTGFVLYYVALNDGNIAEIWFSVYAGDQQGFDAATKC